MPPRKKAAAAQKPKEAGGVPIAGASGIGMPGGSGVAAGVQAIPPARKKRTDKNPAPNPAPNPPSDPAPPNPPASGRDTGGDRGDSGDGDGGDDGDDIVAPLTQYAPKKGKDANFPNKGNLQMVLQNDTPNLSVPSAYFGLPVAALNDILRTKQMRVILQRIEHLKDIEARPQIPHKGNVKKYLEAKQTAKNTSDGLKADSYIEVSNTYQSSLSTPVILQHLTLLLVTIVMTCDLTFHAGLD